MSETGAILATRNASMGYGNGDVVSGLDLEIAPGRFTALLGPNGCGKSTILRSLAGLHRLQGGEVLLDGKPIARQSARAIARRVGILAQSASPPDGLTVEDLVRQGRYPHRSIFGSWSERDAEAVEEEEPLILG